MTWKLVKLGDVCHLQNGFAFKSKLFKDKGLPILRISNIQNERIDTRRPVYFNARDYNVDLKKYEVNTDDLLIAMSGATTGKIGFNKSQTTFYLNQRVGKLIPGKDLDKKYLYYLLTTKVEENLRISKGAAQPNLSSEQIKNIDIGLPPLQEQQHIVAKLDLSFAEIDMAIDLDEQRLLKIDLFKAAVLKNEFDISSKKIKLKNLVVYDKQQGEGSNLPYVGMENISTETMQLIGDIIVPEKTSSTFKFNNTHVLFGRLRPYLKKVLIPNFEGQCSTEIFCLKPNEKINKSFLAYWLLSPSISNKINKSSTGARMPRANMNELLNYDFPDFSFSNQQQIVNRIDTAFTLIENFKEKISKKISNFKSLKLSIISQKLKNKVA